MLVCEPEVGRVRKLHSLASSDISFPHDIPYDNNQSIRSEFFNVSISRIAQDASKTSPI
ncbi:hypothetical protein SCLCIDRAFT_1224884 [Scleroderma citrinum Foug A]|uniref:Uncharacterized protein n=1 Tax=Scleroderma citrinum Foug A TaxID=1036808 RepID=A0A0C2YMU2_9AGAM|nr:hypothetical protein SCLCIDRAFT_1224884 [Scleroderma citrinum Foug A]